MYTHILRKAGSSVRLIFFDFSCAFNTIQPHLLVQKRVYMKSSVISWIFDYLTNRLQYVRLNGVLSSFLWTNTGAPQGTILAPFLFSLYTADRRSTDGLCPVVKFADDTELVEKSVMMRTRFTTSRWGNFVNWCDKKIICIWMFLKLMRCVLTLGRVLDVPNQSTLKDKRWRW